ncbi:MAG: TonB-dependent receptor [Pedosphaera sp.]|nr:TonB-dependent receptor [Pedosphaera sp.]
MKSSAVLRTMNPMKNKNPATLLALFCGWIALFLAPTPTISAADQAVTGTVEGRVLNAASGQYLEKARLTITGTRLETFSDSEGNYRFVDVPAGTANVKVFFTGLPTQTKVVVVRAGQTVQHDISFTGEVVRLSTFVVEASREMTGAAIAINEQRHAPSIKSVTSTDEFGMVAEGNAGEFLKFVPGISVDSNSQGGNARYISINGVPSNYVPVTIGGFALASAGAPNRTNRDVEIDMVPMHNISRIEVVFSPTPETSASALAGSVNMVPRSAFERSQSAFSGSAFVMMRDASYDNFMSWGKTPGPLGPTRKVFPGFNYSAIVPVNKKFGFTLSGGISTQFTPGYSMGNTWRGASAATNGGAIALTQFPHTTPDKPYLSAYNIVTRDSTNDRKSLGTSFDFKLASYGSISLSVQYAYNMFKNIARNLTFNIGAVAPENFTTTSTHGNVGAGSIVQNNGGENRVNWTFMPTVAYRHNGPIWKVDAGIGYSLGNTEDKWDGFEGVGSGRSSLTISFDDITYLRPNLVTVKDGATGAVVDPYSINNYQLRTFSNDPRLATNIRSSAHANVGRDFIWRVPLTLKAGLKVSRELRDNPGSGNSRGTFVGADGRLAIPASGNPSLTSFAESDDSAAPFLDPSYSQRIQPFGFPALQAVHNVKLWEYYNAFPSHFVLDELGQWNTFTSTSKRAEEIISAGYIRGDLAFFERRLRLVGGLRAEQTNIKAEGPLMDPTRNVRRAADGKPLLGADGRPLPITTNALEVAKLIHLRRGMRVENEYLRLFPSLNASFNVRENLIARAAFYNSVGRPDFNQYSGGITLPDLTSPPSPTKVIAVNNADIKAWSARTLSARLEYYFEGIGLVSIGGFRRDFKNFFGTTDLPSTPEFLGFYGLDPELYKEFPIRTQYNVSGAVRMTGFDVNYKQALTFLPHWARGVQVFANTAHQRTTGPETANFTGFIPRTGSWGISLTRPKYNVRMNWNYQSRSRRGIITGASIGDGTYNWGAKQLQLDILGEYLFYKTYAVFANLRNLTDEPQDAERSGPSTPEHARFGTRSQFGALWTFGIKGNW